MRTAPRFHSFAAWSLLFLGVALWGGLGYLVMYLDEARTRYADLSSTTMQAKERQESLVRLRSLVESTQVERAALESLLTVRIVDAVETLEETLRVAGAKEIEINEASAGAANPQGISSVSIALSAAGSFTTLLRAVLLLESIPLPATIEQFEISKHEKEWRLVARLRLSLANVQ